MSEVDDTARNDQVEPGTRSPNIGLATQPDGDGDTSKPRPLKGKAGFGSKRIVGSSQLSLSTSCLEPRCYKDNAGKLYWSAIVQNIAHRHFAPQVRSQFQDALELLQQHGFQCRCALEKQYQDVLKSKKAAGWLDDAKKQGLAWAAACLTVCAHQGMYQRSLSTIANHYILTGVLDISWHGDRASVKPYKADSVDEGLDKSFIDLIKKRRGRKGVTFQGVEYRLSKDADVEKALAILSHYYRTARGIYTSLYTVGLPGVKGVLELPHQKEAEKEGLTGVAKAIMAIGALCEYAQFPLRPYVLLTAAFSQPNTSALDASME
ncbi:hypothetical protein HDU85_003411 [Gaertneriomyces sp. JEL0708]|nr:hypothetical protein HDU85_003411 [Gaertneriomyces sp. JEL0708]